MKTAKSYKILFLLVAFVLCAVATVCTLNFGNNVKADGAVTPSPSNYFTGASVEFKNDSAVATLTSGDELSVNNKLVVDNLALNVKVGAGVSKLTVTLKSNSFYKSTSELVDNVLVLDFDTKTVSFNEEEETNANIELNSFFDVSFVANDNCLTVVVGGKTIDSTLKIGNFQKCVASLSFAVTLANETDSAELSIASIGQKGNDAEYKQTFVLTENALTPAKPLITLGSDFEYFTESNIQAYNGRKYTLSYNVFSVLGNVTSSALSIKNGSGYQVYGDSKEIQFNTNGAQSFEIVNGETTIGSYSVNVSNEEDDNVAPTYNLDSTACDEFETALENAIKEVYDGETRSIRLGKKITIPSMANIVSDDKTPYGKLTHTMYYRTPNNTETTTSGWDITASAAGKYTFFVSFADLNGNSMKKDDFYVVDENDGNKIDFDTCQYKDYFFTFELKDDAPLSVTAGSQGTAYVGVVYNATSFKVDSSDYSTTYKLYYNPKANATLPEDIDNDQNWVLIPSASSAQEDGVFAGGLTYDTVKSIAYDGSLSFKPHKVGTYAIKCTVESSVAVRASSATALITAQETSVVKPNDHWLENNVWSIVFLSIGSLCLVGIIVLIFIKPKEVTVKPSDEEIKKKK